ncbi:MAG: hypothetical protein AAB428_02575 [Patescibacteria group bacterium]
MAINESKEHVLRFRVANIGFLNIKKGSKKIETRAATSRFRKIEKGDMLVLSCGKEKLKKQVLSVKRFESIPALFKTYRLKDVMPEKKSIEEATLAYYSYHGYEEKIKKFGLIAFKLKS